MYCKFCGKQIEDDSLFCKFCGKKVSSRSISNPSSKMINILDGFKALSKSYQVSIILYSIWFLGWICFLIANADERHFGENCLLPFFLFTVLFPFVGICSIYLYRLTKKKHRNESQQLQNTIEINKKPFDNTFNLVPEGISVDNKMDTENNPISYNNVTCTESLLSFHRKNGKMQIIEKINESTMLKERYCLFAASNGDTKLVYFSEQTKNLTAQEISEKKYQLCIEHQSNGSFILNYVNDKQIEDSLPF